MNRAHSDAEEILQHVGLGNKADTLAYNLTLSEKKSLEIAKALAVRPKLLLLDECFAGLSPVDVEKMVHLVRNISKELSLSVLIVEHVMKAVMEVCNRVLVLASGKIIADGAPGDVVKDERVIQIYLGKTRGVKDA